MHVTYECALHRRNYSVKEVGQFKVNDGEKCSKFFFMFRFSLYVLRRLPLFNLSLGYLILFVLLFMRIFLYLSTYTIPYPALFILYCVV